MTQQTFFNQTIEKKKREGMEAAYEGSNTLWREAVNDRMREILQTKDTFTSDDIIIHLNEKGIFTKENRALGAILTAYARTGQIESTGTQVRCKRKSRHHGYVTLWRVV